MSQPCEICGRPLEGPYHSPVGCLVASSPPVANDPPESSPILLHGSPILLHGSIQLDLALQATYGAIYEASVIFDRLERLGLIRPSAPAMRRRLAEIAQRFVEQAWVGPNISA
jgi:hypothetical protein